MGARLIMLVSLVLALAGCGGVGGSAEPTGIDKALLEERIEKDTDLAIVPYGGGTSSVSCVEDGDGWHFTCFVTIEGGTYPGERYVLKATCDKSGGGTCVWRED